MNIFARRSARSDLSGSQFRLISGGAVRTIYQGSGRNVIALCPMKSLSVDTFSFPFSSVSKIRSALTLQVMPYSAAGGMDIFPVVINKSGRNSSGIAFYVSPDELNIPFQSSLTWPCPLAFAGGLEPYAGNGLTICDDGMNISSILWQSYCPVLYRWLPNSGDEALRGLSAWADAYCAQRSFERGGNFAVDLSSEGDLSCDIQACVAKSLSFCPWLTAVNLSENVIRGAKDLENALHFFTKIAGGLAVLELVIAAAFFFAYLSLSSDAGVMQSRYMSLFRDTFSPPSDFRGSPLGFARDKIASLSQIDDEGRSLVSVLADLGDVFDVFAAPGSSPLIVDTIRYSLDGLDCTGTAPDMSTVLNFRRSWENKAKLVQVDNTQFVSGIGYRFDIRIRW